MSVERLADRQQQRRAGNIKHSRPTKASVFSGSQPGRPSTVPVARMSLIPCSIQGIALAVSPEALRAQPREICPAASQFAPAYCIQSGPPPRRWSSQRTRLTNSTYHFAAEFVEVGE